MSNYYIATRASFKEMESAVGARVSRLNQKMATTLRQAAMALDIKQKTKSGGRLEFYSVDQNGYDMLTDAKNKMFAVLKGADNVRPLAVLRQADLVSAINGVNAKYSGRMDYATHRKYLAELKQATGALLTKLEADVQPAREIKARLAPNPFKVGDLLTADWEYSAPVEFRDYANKRVARVSDTYVWLEYVCFKEHLGVTGAWSNTDSAAQAFNAVKTYGEAKHWDSTHGHFIPLEGNEDSLEWRPAQDHKGRLVRHRWDKVTGYRVRNLGQTGQAGYCYSREPRWD